MKHLIEITAQHPELCKVAAALMGEYLLRKIPTPKKFKYLTLINSLWWIIKRLKQFADRSVKNKGLNGEIHD